MKLSFYKGVGGKWGGLQLHMQLPHFYCPVCKKKDFDSNSEQMCSGVETRPHEETKTKSREGCVFIECAKTLEKDKYDWEHKIIFALSVLDMAKVRWALNNLGEGEDLTLMHDPGAKSATAGKVIKTMKLSAPKGHEVGIMVNFMVKDAGSTDLYTVTIPMDKFDCLTLDTFLAEAMVKSLAW